MALNFREIRERLARDLALKGAEARLASLLEEWARTSNDRAPKRCIQLRHQRREIAEMIGVSTETLIRFLAKLKKKGRHQCQSARNHDYRPASTEPHCQSW
jgi:CRP-like cAMP-binding protein